MIRAAVPSVGHRWWRLLRLHAFAGAALCVLDGHAQAIRIQTPELPPRASGAVAAVPAVAPAQTPTAVYGAQAPTYGTPAAQSGYGTQPTTGSQGAPATGTAYGTSPSAGGYGQGAVGSSMAAASPMQQRRAMQGAVSATSPQAYGAPPQGSFAAPAIVTPTPSAGGGACRVQPAPDRQSLSLLGVDGLPRRHVPLGDFRSQLVVHSPDGQWAVAITKLRGEPRFGAMALDLARCESRHAVDLPGAADDVRFEAGVAMIRLTQGEHRMPLADPGVR